MQSIGSPHGVVVIVVIVMIVVIVLTPVAVAVAVAIAVAAVIMEMHYNSVADFQPSRTKAESRKKQRIWIRTVGSCATRKRRAKIDSSPLLSLSSLAGT